MDNVKPLLQSKTLIGITVSALGKILAAVFGVTLDDQSEAQLYSLLSLAISFGGDAFAFYGRLKASTRLK
jgi:hypothetical protein